MKLWAKILLISLLSLFIGVAIYSYFQRQQEQDRKLKTIEEYKNYWSIGSKYECKLTKAGYSFIVTGSNRNDYINGIINVTINNDSISINNSYKLITAGQVAWVTIYDENEFISTQKNFDSFQYMNRTGFPNIYSIGNIKYIFDIWHSITIIKDNKENIYDCIKISNI